MRKSGKRSCQVGQDPGHSRTMYLLILGQKPKTLGVDFVCLRLKAGAFSPKTCEVVPVPQIKVCLFPLLHVFVHGGIYHDHTCV